MWTISTDSLFGFVVSSCVVVVVVFFFRSYCSHLTHSENTQHDQMKCAVNYDCCSVGCYCLASINEVICDFVARTLFSFNSEYMIWSFAVNKVCMLDCIPLEPLASNELPQEKSIILSIACYSHDIFNVHMYSHAHSVIINAYYK